jgi:hypothetical protein
MYMICVLSDTSIPRLFLNKRDILYHLGLDLDLDPFPASDTGTDPQAYHIVGTDLAYIVRIPDPGIHKAVVPLVGDWHKSSLR